MNARDREHVKVLGICFLVFGGLNLLAVALYPLIGQIADRIVEDDALPDMVIPDLVQATLVFAAVVQGAKGILDLVTGYCLLKRRARIFCLVMAGISCISIPLGTILGVFTLIVLARESVRTAFAAGDAPDREEPA
jgi:hypothetical protein